MIEMVELTLSELSVVEDLTETISVACLTRLYSLPSASVNEGKTNAIVKLYFPVFVSR